MAAAAQRQRERASVKGVAARLRPVREQEPKPASATTAYHRAADQADGEQLQRGLLRQTVGLLKDAQAAEAWTAIGKLHALACEQAERIHAARTAKVETTTDEALAAEAREHLAALPEAVRLRLVGV